MLFRSASPDTCIPNGASGIITISRNRDVIATKLVNMGISEILEGLCHSVTGSFSIAFFQIYVILKLNEQSVIKRRIHMKTTEQQHNEKKQEIMEKCFECYAENGLNGTGIKALANACGFTQANLYSYFENLDDLIIQSLPTAWLRWRMILWRKRRPTRPS